MARRRWTYEEDLFLVEFYDALGPFVGPHDLGRSKASTIARVEKLKECGGWEALERLIEARRAYCNAIEGKPRYKLRMIRGGKEQPA